MTPELQKIHDRITKMLRLASDPAAAEGERDNALRMAHNLMRKYAIDMADLSGRDAQGRYSAPGRHIHEMEVLNRPWALGIAFAMCKLNFCTGFYSRQWDSAKGKWKRKVKFHIVGNEGSAVTAALFVEEMVSGTYRQYSRAKDFGTTYARSFALGVWSAINRKVKEMLEQDKADTTVAQIMDEENKANEVVLADNNVKAGKSRHKDADYGGFIAGLAHGETLTFNRRTT